MGLNETPSSERLHIGLFGRRNAGKSSLLNALTGQQAAVVSEIAGTTTDPVHKAMELLPLGPVLFIDTPGIDDEGELGSLRIKKTKQILNKTDLALIVLEAEEAVGTYEKEMIAALMKQKTPYILVRSKADLLKRIPDKSEQGEETGIYVSTQNGLNLEQLKEAIIKAVSVEQEERHIVSDILKPLDFVVLVVPVDKAAPKGRLILPQQQTIRDVLDIGAMPVVCRDTELRELLAGLSAEPRLVITDSQAFGKAAAAVPEKIMLTSFSILFARYKGNLAEAVKGAAALDRLQDGDKVLIAEGCTHHRQCEDIGTVKLPRWIKEYTKKDISFEFMSGTGYPEELGGYKMIVHCGACMLTEREMKYRVQQAREEEIPITNYGLCIALMQGILKRSLEPFPEMIKLLT